MKIKFQWILGLILFSSYYGVNDGNAPLIQESPDVAVVEKEIDDKINNEIIQGEKQTYQEKKISNGDITLPTNKLDILKKKEKLKKDFEKLRDEYQYHIKMGSRTNKQFIKDFLYDKNLVNFLELYLDFIESLRGKTALEIQRSSLNTIDDVFIDHPVTYPIRDEGIGIYVMVCLFKSYLMDKIKNDKSGTVLLSSLDYDFLDFLNISSGNQLIPGGIGSIDFNKILKIYRSLGDPNNGLELINSIEKLHFILNEKNKDKQAFKSFDRFRIIEPLLGQIYNKITNNLESYGDSSFPKISTGWFKDDYYYNYNWRKTYYKLTITDDKNYYSPGSRKNKDGCHTYNCLIAIQYVLSLENNKELVENLKKIDFKDIDDLDSKISFEEYQQNKLEANNPPLPLSENGSKSVTESGKANALTIDDTNLTAKVAGIVGGGSALGSGAVYEYLKKKQKPTDIERYKKSQQTWFQSLKSFFWL
jgi:hypothetical protein